MKGLKYKAEGKINTLGWPNNKNFGIYFNDTGMGEHKILCNFFFLTIIKESHETFLGLGKTLESTTGFWMALES